MDQLGYAILWTAEAERRTDSRRSAHAVTARELLHQRDQRARLVARERVSRLRLYGRRALKEQDDAGPTVWSLDQARMRS
jgi:hypothetical protein